MHSILDSALYQLLLITQSPACNSCQSNQWSAQVYCFMHHKKSVMSMLLMSSHQEICPFTIHPSLLYILSQINSSSFQSTCVQNTIILLYKLRQICSLGQVQFTQHNPYAQSSSAKWSIKCSHKHSSKPVISNLLLKSASVQKEL